MTGFEREEAAFRDAFNHRATDAVGVPFLAKTRRRTSVLAVITAAAVASVLVGVAVAVTTPDSAPVDGDNSLNPPPADETTFTSDFEEGSRWKWFGLHAVEVKVPFDWGFAHELVRPDCADINYPQDPLGESVPTSPYVTVTSLQQASPSIRCTPSRPGNPDPAFGDLPVPLWQPYVRLDVARPDLRPQREDGAWTHDGWQLTRRTFDDVQVSVLTAPNEPTLAEQIVASARTVTTNSVGCDTTSPFADGFPQPDGAPVPAPTDVQSIAVCDYSRMTGYEGLQGSWRMTGQPAQDLTAAILDARTGGGPDKPQNCAPDMFGDSAVTLRFFDADDAPLADAYVYSQWCFGNGVVDSSGPRTLTAENCSPVFSRPEVTWWGGQAQVMRLCRQ